jgi:outer membrane protein, heavy metal efflux system
MRPFQKTVAIFAIVVLSGFQSGYAKEYKDEIQCDQLHVESVNLQDALMIGISCSPQLKAKSMEVLSVKAIEKQEGYFPNPELEIEFDGFGGTGEFEGGDGFESAVMISQPVELGGKRKKRIVAAGLESELAKLDYEASRLDTIYEVTNLFYGALASQERAVIAEEILRNSDAVHNAVKARVTAGKVSPVEEERSKIFLAESRLQLERARLEVLIEKNSLASVWGSSGKMIDKVEGDLFQITHPPSVDVLYPLLEEGPDLASFETEIKFREAALKKEKSLSVPDVSVGVGVRQVDATDDMAYLAALSIPILVYDRNQGRVSSSKYELEMARQSGRSGKSVFNAELFKKHQDLVAAYMEASALEDEILPGAQNVFESVKEGYKAGKFGYLDVLDAEKELAEKKMQYVDSLLAYHQARAEIERMIAGPIPDVRVKTEGEK